MGRFLTKSAAGSVLPKFRIIVLPSRPPRLPARKQTHFARLRVQDYERRHVLMKLVAAHGGTQGIAGSRVGQRLIRQQSGNKPESKHGKEKQQRKWFHGGLFALPADCSFYRMTPNLRALATMSGVSVCARSAPAR